MSAPTIKAEAEAGVDGAVTSSQVCAAMKRWVELTYIPE